LPAREEKEGADSMNPEAVKALQGLRVVECATLVAGPFIGRILADFGAEVIHVEHPTQGDHIRKFGVSINNLNPSWKHYSRNKKCITLDISKEKGRDLLFRLLKDADIFIENFRPGRLEEWNIHYKDLAAMNPRLIMVRVTGFGQTGPYRDRPGFGTLIEAMSGFAAMMGEPTGPPTLPPFPLADSIAALYGLYAAMFAIYHRDIAGSGKGQVIDVSIWEGLYSILGANAVIYGLTGEVPKRIGNRAFTSAPRNCYRTQNDRWIVISVSTQTIAVRFFEAMGQPDLIHDPRFNSNENRIKNVDPLDEIVATWMRNHTLQEILEILNKKEVPVAPVFDIGDISRDSHAREREMVIQVPDDEKGTLLMEGVFPKMSRTPGEARHAGKRKGADNLEIFEERLGLSRKEVEELSRGKII
jgi:crotonobetainyl-CoA:carnitine CoA-transferase CaiB-like acyl-CoA transferase